MSGKGCIEIKAKARQALFSGQFLRYGVAYLLLSIVTVFIVVPLMYLLSAGIAVSGIAPFFLPGGKPEPELFLDPGVMVPLLGTLLVFSLLLLYPIGFAAWGRAAMAIAAMRRGLTIGHAVSGWGHGWRMGWIVTVRVSYQMLWTMLLVVPGVVKYLSYAMTEFVAVDHPDWSANRCIAESCRLMAGSRLRYLVLCVSMLGWVLLMLLMSFVPLAGSVMQGFVMAYVDASRASFYEDLLDCDEGLEGQSCKGE